MGRRKSPKRNRSFVMLGRRMLLKDPDWKSLSAAAKLVYIYLKAKFNGANNGVIRLHYSELKGVRGLSSPSTISRSFKELENKGWIKRKKYGGLHRYFNEYELTGKHDDHLS
jgi:DNA-binding MarR family transcriptional regulator